MTIIPFPQAPERPPRFSTLPDRADFGAIVFFTGVRFERHEDSPAVQPPSPCRQPARPSRKA